MIMKVHRGYHGKLKAVIFDWAGTTIDYGSCAPATVFLDLFHRRGLELTVDQVRAPMGLPKKDHIRAILQMEVVISAWQERYGNVPNETDVEVLYQDYLPLQISSIQNFTDLIPGTTDAVSSCRAAGLKIGSTTGYTMEMMQILAKEARHQGFEPDCIVVPSQVPAGRPHPFMCWQAAMQLQVYPPASIVKVGDTVADIQEGLNAGMWTIGVTKTGNEIGLRESEIAQLPEAELRERLDRAYQRLAQAGAHLLIDGVADLKFGFAEIDDRLSHGEHP